MKRRNITGFWLRLCGVMMVFSLIALFCSFWVGPGMEKHVIAFISFPEGYNKVYLIDIDRMIVAKLSDQTANACCLSWSPDGSLLAFASNYGNAFQIFIIGADGKNLRQLTADRTSKFYLRWSPDGQQIAFLAFPDLTKDTQHIRVINVDGTQEREIAETNIRGASVIWSPDGKRIVFASDQDNDSEGEIYAVTLSADDAQVLSPHGSVYGFSAWAGNETIVLTKNYQLYGMDFDGDQILQITHTSNAVNVNPSLSPDGKQIAFQSDRTGKTQIYRVDLDGSHEQQLTFNDAHNSQPLWSPDGSKIMFLSQNIFVMDVDGNNQRQLTFGNGVGLPAWQP